MHMPNSKSYIERLNVVLSDTEAKLDAIKTTYANHGFTNVADKGFCKSNVIRDLNALRGIGVSEETEMPSLGVVNGYKAINAIPLKGFGKNGVKYADPEDPSQIYSTTNSNTLATDRADGDASINRWSTRNIFKFKDEYYGYDRCVYRIPIADLANGIIIDGGEDAPHENTLANYPYPEEIVMISQKSERNFVHFINVQYSDGHYGHYNGRNYNFMIVKDRTRYGMLNDSGDGFKKFTSVYANDVETELAYIADGYLYLPVPDAVYGEEMLNSLWDCRVVWRSDAPNRNVNIELALEENTGNLRIKDNSISDINRHWNSICYGNGKFVAISGSSNIFAYSDDGITWTEGTISSTKRSWSSVCYGNGKFVAVAYTDIFAYSTDGINWTEVTVSDTNRYWQSVCYGNGKFVAVSNDINNISAYSTDGINWTEVVISDTNGYWESVCYGNDKFVAVANNSNIFAYSTDGINWTEVTVSDTNRYWQSVCYGNGKFVAVSDSSNNISAYSTDGINWTEVVISDTTRSWSSICYGNGKFVAVAQGNVFAYSDDGITWTEVTVGTTSKDWTSICYGNDKYVAVAYNSNIGTNIIFIDDNNDELSPFNDFDISNDRIHMFNKSSELVNKKRSEISNFNKSNNREALIFSSFIMTNNGEILIAPNFVEKYNAFEVDYFKFTESAISNANRYWESICYGNDKFVAVAQGNVFAYSTDGITWTEGTISSTSRSWYYVCYGNDRFVSVANNSNIFAYSTDGINWTEVTVSDTNRYWQSVCYGNGKFVAVSINSNIFAYSSNGINWTEVSVSDTSREWRSVCYGNDKFVAVAQGSNIFAYSTDGINWTEVIVSDTPRFWESVCYGNGKFVAVASSSNNISAYSTDGINWTEVSVSDTTRSWSSICYGNGKFVAVANYCYIFAYSDDGITWTECTINNTVMEWNSICYGNDKFVAVSNDINIFAYSTDGVRPGTPNQFFSITDKHQIGFYYYNPINRGASTAITDFANRTSQLYFNLFNNAFSPINTSDNNDIYPCSFYNSSFVNTGKIIKVFVDSINKSTGISSFSVFTQTGVYKFTFTISGDTLTNTSIEELLTYSDNPYFVMRISKEEFWVYSNTIVNKINIVDKTNITISNTSGRVLLGRACGGNISGTTLDVVVYTDNAISVNGGTQSVNPIETNNMIGKYGYFKNIDGLNTMCKLVEIYRFDKEMDEFGRWKWTEGIISDTNRDWRSVCYGNDKFVAVAGNIVAYSNDGINWTEVTVGSTSIYWCSICYGNDKFVALSSNSNTFAYSTDGITWTEVIVSDTKRSWSSICYGNGKFVAVTSDTSRIFAYSNDGINWTEVTIRNAFRPQSVCYGNGKFVAISGSSNVFAYSTDGITWREGAISSTNRYWYSVCYGNDKFVAIASGNTFAYSTDGITWTEVTVSNTSRSWTSICYGNGKFIAVASNNIFAYSNDGINWTEVIVSDTSRNWYSVCYGNDKFVVVTRDSNVIAYGIHI